jgi:DNA-binding SARP family transcriptional activator
MLLNNAASFFVTIPHILYNVGNFEKPGIKTIELPVSKVHPFDEGLQITLLGGFRIHQGDELFGPENFRLHKACALFELLLLAPRHRLLRDQILEWLWPNHTPESSTNSLYQALHAARQFIEKLKPPIHILFEDNFLSLQTEAPIRIDIEAFETAAEKAFQNQAISLHETAVSLYSGELLPENRYDEWADRRREELQQTYLDLLLNLAHLYQAQGDYKAAISAQRQILAVDPLIEEAHSGLMVSFALSGRRSQALRQYQILQDILQKNYQAEPGPETIRLYRLILEGKYHEIDPQSG